MSVYLFIGGTLDGKWCAIPEEKNQWRVPRIPGFFPIRDKPSEITKFTQVEVDTYVKVDWFPMHKIFALDYLTPEQIIDRLINNYHVIQELK